VTQASQARVQGVEARERQGVVDADLQHRHLRRGTTLCNAVFPGAAPLSVNFPPLLCISSFLTLFNSCALPPPF
jgi:hypothetical protein